MSDILKNFYDNYEAPAIQKITVGFSGIDPIPKAAQPLVISDKTDSGTDLYAYITQKISQLLVTDHEQLEGLLGGKDNDHYHISEQEYDALYKIITQFSNSNGTNTLTNDEYNRVAEIIAALFPDEDSTKPVFPTHEELAQLQGGSANEHYHLTQAELQKTQRILSDIYPIGATEPVYPSSGTQSVDTDILGTDEFNAAVDARIDLYDSQSRVLDCGEITI